VIVNRQEGKTGLKNDSEGRRGRITSLNLESKRLDVFCAKMMNQMKTNFGSGLEHPNNTALQSESINDQRSMLHTGWAH